MFFTHTSLPAFKRKKPAIFHTKNTDGNYLNTETKKLGFPT